MKTPDELFEALLESDPDVRAALRDAVDALQQGLQAQSPLLMRLAGRRFHWLCFVIEADADEILNEGSRRWLLDKVGELVVARGTSALN